VNADIASIGALLAPVRRPSSFRESEQTRALKHARTCYDHLAGELGVAVADALVDRRVLARADDAFTVTRAGSRWLGSLGIDLDAIAGSRRDRAVRSFGITVEHHRFE
jgi:hypothetical protein